jgi:hypothetical protein
MKGAMEGGVWGRGEQGTFQKILFKCVFLFLSGKK